MKKGVVKTIVKIVIIIALILGFLLAAGYAFLKLYLAPKYIEELTKNGQENLAQIIDKNTNLEALSVFSSLFTDKEIFSFLKNMNKETAKSVIEVIDTLDKEFEEVPQNNQTDSQWKVNDIIIKNQDVSKPVKKPEKDNKKEEKKETNKNKTAYDRIKEVASAQEMADGLKIISKLNVSYVLSLTSGGITQDEKRELLKYVRSTLTSAEISRALTLYRKYNKYL